MPDDWSPVDYALGAGALAAVYADIQSTKKLLNNGGSELNPLIGSKPSKGKLNAVGLLTSAAMLGGADQMPSEIRRPFLAGMMTMRAVVADQNNKGKKFKGFADAMKRPVAAGLIAAFLGHTLLDDDSLMVSMAPGKVPTINLDMKF